MVSTFYTSSGKEVFAGDLVLADDLNDINTAVDSGFQLVEAVTDNLADNQSYYADLAEAWAENPEDDAVELGKYSALHHATKAATSSSTATTQAGIATTQAGIATVQAGLATSRAADALLNKNATDANVILTNADVVLTNADVVLTHADVISAALSESNALAYRDTASGHATTATTQAGIATTQAGIATAAADSIYQHINYFEQFDVVGDGVTDDTVAIQEALDASENGCLHITSKTYKHGALTFPSNIQLNIEPGTVFEAISGIVDGVSLWNINNKENITINGYGVTLQGIKAEYVSGEQRHGVYITGSNNITIYGIASNDTGGDGFYIGGTTFCSNITLIDCSGDNNRRQGLSITNVKGAKVIRPKFTSTTGTPPAAGIDIEPNNTTDFIENVLIDNPVLSGGTYGLLVVLENFDASSSPTSIVVNNLYSDGDAVGIAIANIVVGTKGTILINNPEVRESTYSGIMFRDYCYGGITTTISLPKVIDANQIESTSLVYGAGILIYAEASDGGSDKLGGINIINPSVYSEGTIKNTRAITITDLRSVGVQGVGIIEPIVLTAETYPCVYLGNSYVDVNISDDKFRQLEYESIDASYTLYDQTYVRWFSTVNFSTTRSIILNPTTHVGKIITFEIESTNALRILPGTGVNILPLSTVTGKYITSDVVGSRITLKKVSATSWRVIDQIGTWAVES